MKPKNPPADTYQIRCPKLGHQIYFSYCRTENFGIPCPRTLDCWHPHFAVKEFLQQELTPETWDAAFETPPKPKMLSIIEILEQVRKRRKS